MLYKNLYAGFVLLLLCLFSLTGCAEFGDYVKLPKPPSTVEEIDADIALYENLLVSAQKKVRRIENGILVDPGIIISPGGHVSNPTEYAEIERDIVVYEEKIESLKKQRKKLTDESFGCFLPDSLVQMGDGSYKPFVEIVPGDKVMSYDIGYDKLVSRPVVQLYSVASNHLYKINNEFETTGGERLLTQEGWKEINSLKKGDVIHVDGEMIEVFAIEFIRTNHRLYNMQVDNTHNFYVSTANGTRYLVHNSGGGGGGGGGGAGK